MVMVMVMGLVMVKKFVLIERVHEWRIVAELCREGMFVEMKKLCQFIRDDNVILSIDGLFDSNLQWATNTLHDCAQMVEDIRLN